MVHASLMAVAIGLVERPILKAQDRTNPVPSRAGDPVLGQTIFPCREGRAMVARHFLDRMRMVPCR
jgi:hypothetical protein